MEKPFQTRWKLGLRAFALSASVTLATVNALGQRPPGPPPGAPPPPLPPEVLAQQPSGPPPDLPDPAVLREELTMLYEFLSAPPEKLARMRRKIEMIEKMSPENREFLRVRLVQLQADAPALQAEIEKLTEGFSKVDRASAVRYWLSLSADERAVEREHMGALDEAKRLEHLRQRTEAFTQAQAQLRSRLLDSEKGPPDFIPPPPPFLRDSPGSPPKRP